MWDGEGILWVMEIVSQELSKPCLNVEISTHPTCLPVTDSHVGAPTEFCLVGVCGFRSRGPGPEAVGGGGLTQTCGVTSAGRRATSRETARRCGETAEFDPGDDTNSNVLK